MHKKCTANIILLKSKIALSYNLEFHDNDRQLKFIKSSIIDVVKIGIVRYFTSQYIYIYIYIYI